MKKQTKKTPKYNLPDVIARDRRAHTASNTSGVVDCQVQSASSSAHMVRMAVTMGCSAAACAETKQRICVFVSVSV